MHFGSGLFGWAVSGADAKNAMSEVAKSVAAGNGFLMLPPSAQVLHGGGLRRPTITQFTCFISEAQPVGVPPDTSATGRCCRKSRKSNDAKNLANGDFWTTPPLRCSVVPIRRSVVVFLRRDVVLHVAAHETHQQLQKISIVTPKKTFS